MKNKFKMELTWHSCTDCLPEEDYSSWLHITDGKEVQQTIWRRDHNWQRFIVGGCYIEPGVNSDNYWWADLDRTVRETKEFKKR